jgi:hypothetical protein
LTPKEREGTRGAQRKRRKSRHARFIYGAKEREGSIAVSWIPPVFDNRRRKHHHRPQRRRTWFEFKLEVQAAVRGLDDPGHALGQSLPETTSFDEIQSGTDASVQWWSWEDNDNIFDLSGNDVKLEPEDPPRNNFEAA